MKKKRIPIASILIAATIVILLNIPLFATETHVVGLGVPLWLTNDDSLGYKLFPSILLDKKSGTFFEFTGSLDDTLGFSSFPVPWWNVGIVTATASGYNNDNLLGNAILRFCPNSRVLAGLVQCNLYPRGYALLDVFNGKLFLGINMPFQGIVSTGVAQFGIGYARKISFVKAGALMYFGREATSVVQLPIAFPANYKRGSQWYKSLGTFGILLSASTKKFMLPIDLSLNISFPYATDISKVLKTDSGYTIYENTTGRSGFKMMLAARTQIKKFRIFLGLGYNRLNNYADSVSYITQVSPPAKYSETNIDAVTSNIGLYSGGSYSMTVKNKLWLATGLLLNLYIPWETATLDTSCVYRTCTRAQTYSYRIEKYSGFQFDAIVFLGGTGKLSEKWRISGGMSKPILSYSTYSYVHNIYNGSAKTDDSYSASQFTSTPLYVNVGVSGKVNIFNLDFALKTILQRHYNPIFEPYLAASVRW